MTQNAATISSDVPGPVLAEPPSRRGRLAAELRSRVVAARDLDRRPCTPPAWLWQGYLGPGRVTLLTSQWKSGKSTLVSLVLARLQEGGQLAGLPVAAGHALVISEESEADWQPRFQHLGIRDRVDLLCRPFTAQPGMDEWLALIETALDWRPRQENGLVVFDSLAHFLPGHSENSAGALLECLTPLQRLAAAGQSVLLVHHPRKGKTLAGQAARGSGALPSFVDILIEMEHYTAPDDLDRRRRLLAYSRHDQTPRHLLIEFLADGSDYVVLQSGVAAALGESWQPVLHVLSQAYSKMTRQEILDFWPQDFDKPNSTTLWRWLSRAAAQGLVRQEGTGRPNHPFRYWLPEREALMRPDGGTREELQAWNRRMVAEIFGRPEPTSESGSAEEPCHSDHEEQAAAVSATDSDGAHAPVESGSSGAQLSETAAPHSVEYEEPPAAELAAPPELPVRLPYPWNMVDPAKVPEWVWQEARAAQGNK